MINSCTMKSKSSISTVWLPGGGGSIVWEEELVGSIIFVASSIVWCPWFALCASLCEPLLTPKRSDPRNILYKCRCDRKLSSSSSSEEGSSRNLKYVSLPPSFRRLNLMLTFAGLEATWVSSCWLEFWLEVRWELSNDSGAELFTGGEARVAILLWCWLLCCWSLILAESRLGSS